MALSHCLLLLPSHGLFSWLARLPLSLSLSLSLSLPSVPISSLGEEEREERGCFAERKVFLPLLKGQTKLFFLLFFAGSYRGSSRREREREREKERERKVKCIRERGLFYGGTPKKKIPHLFCFHWFFLLFFLAQVYPGKKFRFF